MTGVAGLIVIVRFWVPVPPVFVALIVPDNGPTVVGVPVNFPVVESKLIPVPVSDIVVL